MLLPEKTKQPAVGPYRSYRWLAVSCSNMRVFAGKSNDFHYSISTPFSRGVASNCMDLYVIDVM